MIQNVSNLMVTQIIGAAYTFEESRLDREYLDSAKSVPLSKEPPFAYFQKGDAKSISKNGEPLILRTDPQTGKLAIHVPEPELAMLIGARHKAVAFCLANDLTASSIERQPSKSEFDQTYLAKAWFRSGSYGPKFVEPRDLPAFDEMTIGLKILRKGKPVYDQSYSLILRNRDFSEIPDCIVSKLSEYGDNVPMSQRVRLDGHGFLIEGTLIFLGSGLVVPHSLQCQEHDVVEVSCLPIGILRNTIQCAE